MAAGGSSLEIQTTAIPWSRDEISSCNSVMKNLLHMFTASVGIATEGQCTGVKDCGIGGKLSFLPRVVSRTNRKNQSVVRRTWIFSGKMLGC